ncbi:cytochrome c [Sinorhizobium meliloti]|uniref:cytochrome c n=1 Tax=Rhizobium meliloti TaxID=382 RepID=UPI00398CFFB8
MLMNASGPKAALVLLAVGAFATATPAVAQTVATDNVRQRQDGMKAMAAAAKTIDGMFKGSSAYDANAFKAAAETIGSHSGERLSSLFDRSIGAPGSKASANVESERPKFDKLAADLGVYASALSAAAERNPDVLSPQMRMQAGDAMMGGPLAREAKTDRDVWSMPAEHAFHLMLQTCTSCHAQFRVRTE